MGRIALYGVLLLGSLGLLIFYFVENEYQQLSKPDILPLVARLLLTISCIVWLVQSFNQYKKNHRRGSLRSKA